MGRWLLLHASLAEQKRQGVEDEDYDDIRDLYKETESKWDYAVYCISNGAIGDIDHGFNNLPTNHPRTRFLRASTSSDVPFRDFHCFSYICVPKNLDIGCECKSCTAPLLEQLHRMSVAVVVCCPCSRDDDFVRRF